MACASPSEEKVCPITLSTIESDKCYIGISDEKCVRYSSKLLQWLSFKSSSSPCTRKVVSPGDIFYNDPGIGELKLIQHLLQCIDNGDMQEVQKCLDLTDFPINVPFSMDASSHVQTTLLGYATFKGKLNAAQMLIDLGASIDCTWCVRPPVGRRCWLTGVKNIDSYNEVKVIDDEDDENAERDRMKGQVLSAFTMCISGINDARKIPDMHMDVLLLLLENKCRVNFNEIETILRLQSCSDAVCLMKIVYSYTHVMLSEIYEKPDNKRRVFDCIVELMLDKNHDQASSFADMALITLNKSEGRLSNVSIAEKHILCNMDRAMKFESWIPVAKCACYMGALVCMNTVIDIVCDMAYSDDLIRTLVPFCPSVHMQQDTHLLMDAINAGRGSDIIRFLMLSGASISNTLKKRVMENENVAQEVKEVLEGGIDGARRMLYTVNLKKRKTPCDDATLDRDPASC